MTDLASISDEWWHGASPNMQGGDYSWGGDEEVYYDPEGNRISKEDYEKQFQNQDKFPVEPEYPEQPQFVGDPTQFKPMPFDPTNPLMYMGSGSPFHHLRGGISQEHIDMLARAGNALYGDLTPEKVMSGAIDAVQDFLKTPEQREAEKRQKAEEERIQKEKEEREKGSWSSILSPFFHLSGGAIDKYIAMAKEFAKRAGYKDWDSLRRADDGEHKLELRGVKFGRKGYGDFIKYSLDEGVDEARKHRDAYLSRATKIKGDWAKDMYSPNSLAIKILWGGGYSGGMKTEAELDAMSVVKLIDYGKTLGVKGLDGKTKKVIMDKIMSHEAKMPEVVAPKEEGGLTPLQLYKMLLMEGHLEKDLIPLAKKQGIERILHKNKKTLVNEIYDNLLANEEIQATDHIEKVPKVVLYLFGKGEDPYALSDYDEDEEGQIELEEEEEDEDPDEVFVTQYIYDTNPYLVENPRAGLEFKDRRVFDPVADNEEMGTLGDMPDIADLVRENEDEGEIVEDEPEEKEKLPQQELDRERMLNILASLNKRVGEPIIDPDTGRPRGADYQAFEKKSMKEDIKAITEQLKRLDSFKEIEGEPPALRSLRVTYGEDHDNYKYWVKKFKKGEGVKKWEYPVKGTGRPYTAEEWEKKLCKGENSLLAQKKQKIKERSEKGKKAPAPRVASAPASDPSAVKIARWKDEVERLQKKVQGHRAEEKRIVDFLKDFMGFSSEGAKRKAELKQERLDENFKATEAQKMIYKYQELIKDEEKMKGKGKTILAPQDVLEGKKDNPVVEEIIEEPMDDTDIRQYLPNAKVMRYSGLARLSDIEQLLPTDKSYVILLYENTPGSGHWVALMRYGRTIEFFCSYGSKIDVPLRWQNPKDNAMLGQTRPFLSLLLNKAKGKFRAIHNPVAYQSSKQGVATCGAWDVMRINQMKNHNQDLQEFHNFMESVKKETGLTYDEIVVNYVSKR